MTTKAQAKAAIYSRLANTPTYHPATVDLFEDFTLQGGDIVSVDSDGNSYNVPVFGMNLKWNGSTTVTAQSSGDEQLEPLEVMAAKQSSRGGYGRSVKQQEEDASTRAYLMQQASAIGLVVEWSGSTGSIKTASIVASINAQTGQSAVGINADKIIIGELNNEDLNTWASQAKAGTGVFAKFLTVRSLTAQEITTMLANIGSADIGVLDVGDLYCDQLVVDGDMSVESIEQEPIGNFLTGAVVNGSTVTFTNLAGDSWTFSKATSTTLSGSWSGRNFTVTASPQGNVKVGTVYSLIVTDYQTPITVDGTTLTRKFYVYSEDEHGDADHAILHQDVSINASSVLETQTLTANGTYTPSSGMLGFSSITVDVQGGSPIDYRLLPTWDSYDTAHLTVERTTSQDYGTTYNLYVVPEIPTLTYNSTTHKYTGTAYAKAGTSRSGATRRGYGEPFESGTEAYDAGANWGLTNVSITGYNMVYQSNTNAGYKVQTRLKGEYNGTVIYENWYTSSQVFNATAAYNNGWSGSYGEIAIATNPANKTTLNPGESVVVKAQGKASSDSGLSDVATVTVSAAAISTSNWSLNYQSSPYTYTASVKVNGTTYTSGNLSATNAYDNGWSGCYGTVGLDSTTATTLNYGQSVTVYAQAKQASGSPSKTNVASRTLTAPADNYTGGHDVVPYIGSTGTTSYSNRTTSITANGTYYAKAVGRSAAGAGYDTQVGGNNRTFTVNVSGPVTWGSISSHSSSQTGINKNYSASAGYHYFVMRFTIGGTTYKIQLHTTT